MSKSSDPNSLRLAPVIRDHETLRQIGRGAFGEVWLARSVTGALRAVKVVWREDYDHVDSFEREFEAIKRYEPISRRHPGLLPILQVGRNEDDGFYYYVMELADDLDKGRDLQPDSYKPHTLGAQMRRDKRLRLAEVYALGTSVAEALDYLHRKKLIHRDVKPSNLVCIDGTWRLADIGLVALLGQRSFVGTEGFVAPEGPGTAASDIFSLGMVLYEASTGKDRLDFPDLPSSAGSGERIDLWRRLNEVICTACAQRARDRYESAAEMSLALKGEPLPSQKRTLVWGGAVAAGLVLAVAFGMWLADKRQAVPVLVGAEAPSVPVVIESEPAGAEVYSGEHSLGQTPIQLTPPQGVPMLYELRKPGYRWVEIEHLPTSGGAESRYRVKLEASKLPQSGERWVNSLDIPFKPRGSAFVSEQPVEMTAFRQFLEAENRPFEGRVVRFVAGGKQIYIVVVPMSDAEAFRYWLTDRDRRESFLSQEHHYEVEPFYFVESGQPTDEMPDDMPEAVSAGGDPSQWQAFYLRLQRQTYGTVVIRSVPEGVKVYHSDVMLGRTPLELPRVRTGAVEYELREEGFSDLVLEGEVRDSEYLELFADMDAKQDVTFGRAWKNSLGMEFVPIGEVMMSAWETRRRDYNEFIKATGARRPPTEGTRDGKAATLPVSSISREEAAAFCRWLTEKERTSGLIGPQDQYRLPTDEEWSRAVGLPLERGADPAQRSGRIRGIYPWGFDWPPPSDSDNFADVSAVQQAGADNAIPDYHDAFSFTAPVTSLSLNDRGLAGLAGNVSEWLSTDYELPTDDETAATRPLLGTVRGGNWRSHLPEELLSSTRVPVPVDARRSTVGFRCVLAREPSLSQVRR
ncbi:MAG: SUMF1/EgtB/PvdO family nonheme iron enzyme [Verrucomicrobiales bacterium]|nr:SUMF1/EgtB/PvdO family nonheme iron enzyme [Verrucomicrobiales bacterium]